MKGYKVFNSDWTCRGFQYEVGKTYKMDKKPVPCERGFHFCKRAVDCFNYYDFNPNNKVAEVEAVGEIERDGDKCCTNEIKIIREIPWGEMLNLVNTGHGCVGLGNSGDWNIGKWNSGNCNTGNRNTGDNNTGNLNAGNYNAGNRNTGNSNTGNCNTGDWNTGKWNTGNYNTGNWNSGDWNRTDYSTGCFNTEMDKIRLFNKLSNWSLKDWWNSDAYEIMLNCPIDHIVWKSWAYMNDEETKKHPEAEVTGGYLAKEEANMQKWWNELSESDKNTVMSLPNFDADIFKKCTGIEV